MKSRNRNIENYIEAIPYMILLAALLLGLCVTYLSDPSAGHARHVEALPEKKM